MLKGRRSVNCHNNFFVSTYEFCVHVELYNFIFINGYFTTVIEWRQQVAAAQIIEP